MKAGVSRKKLVVLHGPNLGARIAALGDERADSLDAIDRLLEEAARRLGVELKLFRSSQEGVLADALLAERSWAQAALLSPGALALSSHVLREAVELFEHPVLEVHLSEVPRAEEGANGSLLAEVCAARETGDGIDSYLAALERLAAGDLLAEADERDDDEVTVRAKGQAFGRRGSGGAKPARGSKASTEVKAARPQKTLGRLPPPAPPSAKSLGRAKGGKPASPAGSPYDELRRRLSERLAGKLSGAELAGWARQRWQQLQASGAAHEQGRLEELLLHLAAAGAKLSDHQLLEMVAGLDG